MCILVFLGFIFNHHLLNPLVHHWPCSEVGGTLVWLLCPLFGLVAALVVGCGWFTMRDKVSRGLSVALIVLAILGLERSRLWGIRARSVTRPFFSSSLTMLFMRFCCPLNTWLGIWPGAGHDSITVLTSPVRLWILRCLLELSGRASDRWMAALISVTRAAWASGQWLAAARLDSSTLARAGQSLSPASWHWGSSWSRINASALHSWRGKVEHILYIKCCT